MSANPRRKFKLTDEEIAEATAFGQIRERTLPAQIREWITAYAAHGTDLKPRTFGQTPVQVPISPAFEPILAEAEERAAREGFTLTEIIRHEIEALDRL